MKRFCTALILTGGMGASNLFASMNVTLYQDTSNYSDAAGGGEFRAVGNSGANSLDSQVNWSAYSTKTSGTTSLGQLYFQTFCTELNESFSPNTQYTVTSIGNNAMTDGTGSPVPITLGVAYLYSQFAAGSLAGYSWTYGSSRAGKALNLQLAIWALMGESNKNLNPAKYFNNSNFAYNDLLAVTGSGAGDVFTSTSQWYVAANGAYGVYDMVLGSAGQHQDQLIITNKTSIPLVPPSVPEPATILSGALLLLPFGAGLVRVLRKSIS
jgi:hypothetical protein